MLTDGQWYRNRTAGPFPDQDGFGDEQEVILGGDADVLAAEVDGDGDRDPVGIVGRTIPWKGRPSEVGARRKPSPGGSWPHPDLRPPISMEMGTSTCSPWRTLTDGSRGLRIRAQRARPPPRPLPVG